MLNGWFRVLEGEVVDSTGELPFNAPVRLMRLLWRFGDELADAVLFLPSLTGVPGLSYSVSFTECMRPERNLNSVVCEIFTNFLSFGIGSNSGHPLLQPYCKKLTTASFRDGAKKTLLWLEYVFL